MTPQIWLDDAFAQLAFELLATEYARALAARAYPEEALAEAAYYMTRKGMVRDFAYFCEREDLTRLSAAAVRARLRRIAHDRGVDERRRANRWPVLDETTLAPLLQLSECHDPTPDARVATASEAKRFRTALNEQVGAGTIGQRDLELLWRKYVLEHSWEAVAAWDGSSMVAVRKRGSRALASLRKSLADEFDAVA